MRELNFRFWNTLTGKFEEDSDLFFVRGDGVICSNDSVENNLEAEQYTGLKDKNGKEIYKGDIVEASIDGVWGTGKNTVGFGKVKWKLEVIYNDIRFMDVFRVIGSKNCPDRIYYLFDKELSELDVIGNIHENSELLEQENAKN